MRLTSARLTGLLTVVLTVLSGVASHAQQITILSAQADLVKGELVVRGSTFQSGTRVFLFLNPAVELQVVSHTTGELHAKLPVPFSAGTFLLAAYHPATGQYGLFSLTMRTALSENVLVDSSGKTIANLDSETAIGGYPSTGPMTGGSVVTLKVSDRRLRMRVAPGGFRSAMIFEGGRFFRGEVAHRDAACSSPHVVDTDDRFVDQAVVTLSDGSQAIAPPYGTIAWVPDYTKPQWVCGIGPTYMRLSDATCVQTSPELCGIPYRPALPIDLGGFAAPFSVR